MRLKIAIAILCLLVLTMASAYAATIRVSQLNMGTLGWKITTKNGGAESGQLVDFENWRTNTVPPTVEALMCSPKKSQSNQLGWAGLSAQLIFRAEL